MSTHNMFSHGEIRKIQGTNSGANDCSHMCCGPFSHVMAEIVFTAVLYMTIWLCDSVTVLNL